MQSIKKRLLASLLAGCMAASMLPSVFAAEVKTPGITSPITSLAQTGATITDIEVTGSGNSYTATLEGTVSLQDYAVTTKAASDFSVTDIFDTSDGSRADGKEYALLEVTFDNLDSSTNYVIKQTNNALKDTAFSSNVNGVDSSAGTKVKNYGTALSSDGSYAFLAGNPKTTANQTITFQIGQADNSSATDFSAGVTPVTLTVTNNLKFVDFNATTKLSKVAADNADDMAVKDNTISGQVDPSVYTVTDSTAKTDFDGALTNGKPKGGKQFALATIKFEGIANDTTQYVVKQENAGMGYVYSEDETLKTGVKVKSYAGSDLVGSGLNFIVPDQRVATQIKFSIQKEQTTDTWDDTAYSQTFTVDNTLSFAVAPFTGSVDNRGFSSLKTTPFAAVSGKENTYEATVSGTVDMRSYAVTDTVLQTDFQSLLTKTNGWTGTMAAQDTSIDPMYVKTDIQSPDGTAKMVFADIDFGGTKIVDNGYYYIKQTNPALNYAYPGSFADGVKQGVNQNAGANTELFTDGMTFIIANKTGDITIQIAVCESGANELDEAQATTFIIHNDVKFTSSDAPATDDPVVEVTPSVSNNAGTVTATATVDTSAATADKVTAAKDSSDKTLVIDAGANMTADKVELTLKKAVVTSLAGADNVTAKIQTPVGEVTLPNEVLTTVQDTIAGNNHDAVLTVEKKGTPASTATAEYEVTLKVNSTAVPVSGLTSPIRLSFNVGANRTDSPVLVYVDTAASNALKPVLSSRYDASTGLLTGETDHLSTFGVLTSVSGKVETGGVGKKVTLTASANTSYLTVQVTNGNANAIYTAKVDGSSKLEMYAPVGSTLTVWETTGVPVFTAGSAAPNSVLSTTTMTLS